jgi:hypothetical protein
MPTQDSFGNNVEDETFHMTRDEDPRTDILEEHAEANRTDEVKTMLRQLRSEGDLSEEDITEAMLKAGFHVW